MDNIGRPKASLVLSGNERRFLETLISRHSSEPALRLRARIVLECSKGMSNAAVAQAEGVAEHTVGKWRARFIQDRLSGLDDAPRSGAPRTIPPEKIARVVKLTVGSKPAHAKRWSTRSMARYCCLTHDTVHRIWRTFGLTPDRATAQAPDLIQVTSK